MPVASNVDINAFMVDLVKDNLPAGVKLIIAGVDIPNLEKVRTWVKYDFLGSFPVPSRKFNIYREFRFQITAYSRATFTSTDNEAVYDEYIKLIEVYNDLLNQQSFCVNNSCIEFQECMITYLDLRTSTFTAKSISTGGNPSLATQAAVLLVNAYQITPKES